MNIIERVKNILITPKTEWEVIKVENTNLQVLFVSYVLPLSLLAAAGVFFHGLIFPGVLGLKFFIVSAIITFVANAVSFFLSSYIINALAGSFNSEKAINKSAQLVAYSSTPSYIASLLSFVPGIGTLISIAGMIYGIYLMYLGIGPLKKTSEEQKVAYMVVAYLVIIAIYFITAAVTGMLLFSLFGVTRAAGFGM